MSMAIKEMGLNEQIVPFETPFIVNDVYLAFGVDEEGRRLIEIINEHLEEVEEDGTLRRLRNKYVP